MQALKAWLSSLVFVAVATARTSNQLQTATAASVASQVVVDDSKQGIVYSYSGTVGGHAWHLETTCPVEQLTRAALEMAAGGGGSDGSDDGGLAQEQTSLSLHTDDLQSLEGTDLLSALLVIQQQQELQRLEQQNKQGQLVAIDSNRRGDDDEEHDTSPFLVNTSTQCSALEPLLGDVLPSSSTPQPITQHGFDPRFVGVLIISLLFNLAWLGPRLIRWLRARWNNATTTTNPDSSDAISEITQTSTQAFPADPPTNNSTSTNATAITSTTVTTTVKLPSSNTNLSTSSAVQSSLPRMQSASKNSQHSSSSSSAASSSSSSTNQSLTETQTSEPTTASTTNLPNLVKSSPLHSASQPTLPVTTPTTSTNTQSVKNRAFQAFSPSPSRRSCDAQPQNGLTFLVCEGRYSSEFQELRRLGRGGFGDVYQCRNRLTSVLYAIKKVTVHVSQTFSEKATAQIYDSVPLREVSISAVLNHPNVVRYFSAWLERTVHSPASPSNLISPSNSMLSLGAGGFSETPMSQMSEPEQVAGQPATLYIQMELCGEGTLSKKLSDPARQICIESALDVLKQALAAVEYIHTTGYIHRDIKPSNIFFEQGKLKIGDFGCSCAIGNLALVTSASNASLPDLSKVKNPGGPFASKTTGVGTWVYAAPEQLNHSHYNEACDVYSLGVVFFEMLHEPFTTASERAHVFSRLRTGEIPAEVEAKFPREVGLVRRMMAKDPKSRPNVRELQGIVERWLREFGDNLPVSVVHPAHGEDTPTGITPTTLSPTHTPPPSSLGPVFSTTTTAANTTPHDHTENTSQLEMNDF